MPPTMRLPRIVPLILILTALLSGCAAIPAGATPWVDAGTITPAATLPDPVTPTVTGSPTPVPAAATATPTPELPAFSNDEMQAQVTRIASGFIDTGRDPALSVALVRRDPQTGQLQALMLNFGTTAKDGGTPVDSNTEYEIGSITKVFTGILLAQAVQSGRMKLDDSLQAHLPPGVHAPDYKGTPITLSELATHRSGLPRDLTSDSLPDLYTWLDTFQLSQKPGSEYIYSNLGYALLGD